MKYVLKTLIVNSETITDIKTEKLKLDQSCYYVRCDARRKNFGMLTINSVEAHFKDHREKSELYYTLPRLTAAERVWNLYSWDGAFTLYWIEET